MDLIIKNNINDLNINFNKISLANAVFLANKLYVKNNIYSTYYKDGLKILVTKESINESLKKIFASVSQKKLLKEHLIIFSKLGFIIQNSKNISTNQKNLYFIDDIVIDECKYNLKFSLFKDSKGNMNYIIDKLSKVNV